MVFVPVPKEAMATEDEFSRAAHEKTFRKDYGWLLDAAMEQLPQGDFCINWIQMRKFMELMSFFEAVKDCQRGLWKEVSFDKGKHANISTTYLVFDTEFDDPRIDMSAVLRNADHISISSAEYARFSIRCTVDDVLVGDSGSWTFCSGKLPKAMMGDLLAKPTSDEELENDPDMIAFNNATQGLLVNLGNYYIEEMKKLDNKDFKPNKPQAEKFLVISHFMKAKVKELHGEIKEIRAEPKEGYGRIIARFPRFEIYKNEIDAYCILLKLIDSMEIDKLTNGMVEIDMSVPGVYLRQ